jgi:hypothetical protein
VTHNLFGTIVPETALWFSLYCAVYEIGCFLGPAEGDFAFFDEGLFGQDFVSDLLARLAEVGTDSGHALVYDHTEGVVVDGDSMIASAHDFRSSDYEIGTHVAWCS